MNANEIIPKNSARLQRIKTVSRIVRYIFAGLFVLSVGAGLWMIIVNLPSPSRTAEGLWHSVLNIMLTMVLGYWYWNLAKLFRFYECGLIFAAKTIHCIKTLGVLCAINWLLYFVLNIVNRCFPMPLLPPLPPGVKLTAAGSSVISSFRIGFFNFSIDGFNIGLLLAGIIIVIIAWIMDEGRKIQEEQELTV